MRANLFYSFVSLIFILFFGLVGLGLVLIYKNPALVDGFFSYVAEHREILLHAGLSLIGFSALLFLLFYAFTKKSVYQVILDPVNPITIEPKAISQLLEQFFKSEKIPYKYQLGVTSRNLEIGLDLSNLEIERQDSFLSEMEPKLMQALQAQIGLPKEVKLSLVCKKA